MKMFTKLLIYLLFFITAIFVTSTQTYAASATVIPRSIDETTRSVTITFSGLEEGGEYFFCLRSDGCFFDQDYLIPVRANSDGIFSITVCGWGNDKVKECESGDYFHQATYLVFLYPDRDPDPDDAVIASFEVRAGQCTSNYGYSSDLHACVREAPPEDCDSNEEPRTVLGRDICILIGESGEPTPPGWGSTSFPSIVELIKDPLPEGRFTSLGGIVSQLSPFLLILGGMVAFLFLIMGGFRYMTAQGDPKSIASARGTITSAIIGLALLASVFVIMTIVEIVFKINILGSLASPAYAQVDIGKEFLFGGEGVGEASRFPDLGTLLGNIVNVALGLAGVVFFVMTLWGGIRYISARGDEKAISDARGTLTNAVIGLLIVIASFAIIKLISIATGATGISIF